MIRKILVLLFISVNLFAAQYNLEIKNDQIMLLIPSEKNLFVSDSIENNIYTLVLDGKFAINEDIWGYPISKIESAYNGKVTAVKFFFENKASKPSISYENGNTAIKFSFKNAPVEKNNVYLRMFVGIVVILIMILILYWLLKIVMKRNISTEIPGTGRLLGKVDIMPGKTLGFYELLDTIYIIGITSEQITLVDKIQDEILCDKIREGFTRKKDFSSYLKFFGKEIDKTEIDMTKEIIKEKVEKLKRK